MLFKLWLIFHSSRKCIPAPVNTYGWPCFKVIKCYIFTQVIHTIFFSAHRNAKWPSPLLLIINSVCLCRVLSHPKVCYFYHQNHLVRYSGVRRGIGGLRRQQRSCIHENVCRLAFIILYAYTFIYLRRSTVTWGGSVSLDTFGIRTYTRPDFWASHMCKTHTGDGWLVDADVWSVFCDIRVSAGVVWHEKLNF